MADGTHIEWTDATWTSFGPFVIMSPHGNEGRGAPICCYAARIDARSVRSASEAGKMVHAMQSVAPAIVFRQRREPRRWAHLQLSRIESQESARRICPQTDKGWPKSHGGTRWRQGTGAAADQYARQVREAAASEHIAMRRLWPRVDDGFRQTARIRSPQRLWPPLSSGSRSGLPGLPLNQGGQALTQFAVSAHG